MSTPPPSPDRRTVPASAARLVERVAAATHTPGGYVVVTDGRGRWTVRFELHAPITCDQAVDLLLAAGCDYWSIEPGPVTDGRRRYLIATAPGTWRGPTTAILIFTEAE